MIAEELKKIKAFGSDRESSVTPEDIAAKEAELGIRLPEALVELYLTFHESAPVFSADYYFVPLHQLEIAERGGTLAPRKMLVFARFSADGTGDGFFLDDKNPEDPLVFRCRAQIKKPGDRTFIMPENGRLSVFLLWHTASRQLRCQPNIIQVSGKQFQGLWDNSRDDWDSAGCEALSQIFDWFLGSHPTEKFDLAGRPQQSPYGFVGTARQSGLLTCLSFGCALIAVDSARQIECVMEEIKGKEWKWIRRDGEDQTSNKPKPVKERKLESILPAIEFLKTYAGIQGEGILEEACIRAEKRTGFSLLAPLKEIWEQIPSSFLSAPARFLPMDEITTEEERVHFLSGWQGIPNYYLKKDSPIVYRAGAGGEEAPFDLLDGFLIAELLWNIMQNEKTGFVLTEKENCSKAMLNSRGKLGRFLKPCFQTITKGCKRQLYYWPEQGVIGLYDTAGKILYLSAFGETPLRQLEKVSGVGLSWL